MKYLASLLTVSSKMCVFVSLFEAIESGITWYTVMNKRYNQLDN